MKICEWLINYNYWIVIFIKKMKILLVHDAVIPVFSYGGTERVVWDLAKGLSALGHKVELLVAAGSSCDFAKVNWIDKSRPLIGQFNPVDYDVVHFQSRPTIEPDFPYIVTEHGNTKNGEELCLNTVFLSRNHAARFGSSVFVYNGLDWTEYGPPKLDGSGKYFHFLGKASWPVKNLRGAIAVAKKANVKLAVLGGQRLNFSRGFRLTLSLSISFHGMVGGQKKMALLGASQGLIFPVRWHEPFGLAVIESLYFGCPVFSTPYGALPELIDGECGVLSASATELASSISERRFDPMACHDRAVKLFSHLQMAARYVEKYEQVVSGERLNKIRPRLAQNGHKLLPWTD